MRNAKALHVPYKFWYLSLPVKQQREMTKFKVLWRNEREHMTVNFHSDPVST